jgi:hypothetical protein
VVVEGKAASGTRRYYRRRVVHVGIRGRGQCRWGTRIPAAIITIEIMMIIIARGGVVVIIICSRKRGVFRPRKSRGRGGREDSRICGVIGISSCSGSGAGGVEVVLSRVLPGHVKRRGRRGLGMGRVTH